MLKPGPGHPYEAFCTPASFRAFTLHPVRWLDWDEDYPLAAACWRQELTTRTWMDACTLGYRYAAVVKESLIISLAAVWVYSEEFAELAAVSTNNPANRRSGYAKSVCSFVTAHILAGGRTATVSTAGDNLAMQYTAQSLGFQQVAPAECLRWRQKKEDHIKQRLALIEQGEINS